MSSKCYFRRHVSVRGALMATKYNKSWVEVWCTNTTKYCKTFGKPFSKKRSQLLTTRQLAFFSPSGPTVGFENFRVQRVQPPFLRSAPHWLAWQWNSPAFKRIPQFHSPTHPPPVLGMGLKFESRFALCLLLLFIKLHFMFQLNITTISPHIFIESDSWFHLLTFLWYQLAPLTGKGWKVAFKKNLAISNICLTRLSFLLHLPQSSLMSLGDLLFQSVCRHKSPQKNNDFTAHQTWKTKHLIASHPQSVLSTNWKVNTSETIIEISWDQWQFVFQWYHHIFCRRAKKDGQLLRLKSAYSKMQKTSPNTSNVSFWRNDYPRLLSPAHQTCTTLRFCPWRRARPMALRWKHWKSKHLVFFL